MNENELFKTINLTVPDHQLVTSGTLRINNFVLSTAVD
jgi:hypothetical protein